MRGSKHRRLGIRAISILLSALMLLSGANLSAFAADETGDSPNAGTTQETVILEEEAAPEEQSNGSTMTPEEEEYLIRLAMRQAQASGSSEEEPSEETGEETPGEEAPGEEPAEEEPSEEEEGEEPTEQEEEKPSEEDADKPEEEADPENGEETDGETDQEGEEAEEGSEAPDTEEDPESSEPNEESTEPSSEESDASETMPEEEEESEESSQNLPEEESEESSVPEEESSEASEEESSVPEEESSEEPEEEEVNRVELTLENGVVIVTGVLPEDTNLDVTTIMTYAKANTEAPQNTSRNNRTLRTMGSESEAATNADTEPNTTSNNGTDGYLGIFDISLSNKEGEVQPDADNPVKVHIEGLELPENKTIAVLHILDNVDAIEAGLKNGSVIRSTDPSLISRFGANAAVLEGEDASSCIYIERLTVSNGRLAVYGTSTIEFWAYSFSVYAVIGAGGDYATMTVNFHALDADGADTIIATMYVKNIDTPAELVKILYDPGVGDQPEDTIFKGWIEGKSNYTSEDVTAGNGKNIDQIRTWAAEKTITDGEVVDFYAMFFKGFKVDYLDENDVSLGSDIVLYAMENETSAPYTVQKGYSDVDSEHHFVGWNVYAGGSHIQGFVEGTNYPNGTDIVITGDVVFSVNAPAGHWLIFHEDHGTYVGPQFIYSGSNTEEPSIEMKKNGYSFGGWFDTPEHAAAHANAEDPSTVTTGLFEFGHEIETKTDLYASWIPNKLAAYTVIFWTQNVDRTGYDVAGSVVVENAAVGSIIPYTFVENIDEDYVTDSHFGDQGHYTGFCLTEASKNQEVTVRPESDSVLNLYFDRIEYNFKFYIYRNGTQNNRYDYANNSGNGSDLNGLVTWHSNQTQHPSVTGFTIQSENIGGRTYYYFVLEAYYGQDISDLWPTYDQIQGANGRNAVSFVMMVGTALKPNPTNQGSGTVKGVISTMDDNILGATNDANGNYVVVRFPDSYYNWRYHIWFETVEGEDYTGKTLHDYNGKTYYEETVMTVRSSNTTDGNQNEPDYQGFDYITRLGQNANGTVWQGGHWTTTENGTTLYHLNYVYNRQLFTISYFDGNYIDGDNNFIQNKAEQMLHESDDIAQGASIPDGDKNYVPTCPEEGYYFAGWFVDEACTVEYEFNKMPIGGIRVYAKWIKVQYRVFLHTNADKDPNFDCGSDDQQWNFRVSFGDQISLPSTMLRTESGYELVGWYLDEAGTQVFNAEAYVLNETTVTAEYDKENTPTDPMDRWGELIEGETPSNKDLVRPWITKKLDVYAVWRKVITGADGVSIEYDAGEGSNPPTDNSLYLDKAFAPAQPASTAPENQVFSHWVVQKYNTSTGQWEDTSVTVYPGETFRVNLDDAQQTANSDNTPEHPSYTYTIKVRAEYIDKEHEDPTYIHFFASLRDKNGNPIPDVTEENQPKDITTYHENIKVNQAVDILSIEQVLKGSHLYDDYIFLGWARVEGGEPMGAKEAWLEIMRNADGSYITKTVDGVAQETYSAENDDGTSSNSVTMIAADEKQPYHNLYAVWEKKPTVTVTKQVTGNMGELEKPFSFTITATQGFTYRTTTYVDGELTPSAYTTEATTSATISLKHGESVTISAPNGTVITVTEANYTGDNGGYDKPTFAVSTGTLGAGSTDFAKTFTLTDTDAVITVTNNRITTPDTGITLDSIPYILLMGAVMIGCFAVIRRRRRRSAE